VEEVVQLKMNGAVWVLEKEEEGAFGCLFFVVTSANQRGLCLKMTTKLLESIQG
jgi:hypothetical protein